MNTWIKRAAWVTLGAVLVILVSNSVRDANLPRYDYSATTWEDSIFRPAYDRQRWNVLFDQHSHTLYSDGVLTPEQNIRWHIAMGFNAMVISDHNTFAGLDEAVSIVRERYADQIVLIPGLEWTTDRVHMNFLFPPRYGEAELSAAMDTPSSQPTDDEIREAIEAARALGALVTVNHIPWTNESWPGAQPGREQFLQWGVDFFEVINDRRWDGLSDTFIDGTPIRPISGTDMHVPGPAFGWTLLRAEEFSAASVFASLVSGQTQLIYLPEGAPYPFDAQARPNPWYVALRPLIAIGDYFTELTWPRIRVVELLVLLGWVYLVAFACWGIADLARKRGD